MAHELLRAPFPCRIMTRTTHDNNAQLDQHGRVAFMWFYDKSSMKSCKTRMEQVSCSMRAPVRVGGDGQAAVLELVVVRDLLAHRDVPQRKDADPRLACWMKLLSLSLAARNRLLCRRGQSTGRG